MKKGTIGFLAVLLVVGLISLAQGQVWDAVADFNNTSGNPSGVWSYGRYEVDAGGAWRLYDTAGGYQEILDNWQVGSDADTHSNVNKNITGNTFSMSNWGPGCSWRPGQLCVMVPYNWGAHYADRAAVRFTAPSTGTYQLTASWENRAMNGNASGVFVALNGATIFSDQVSGFSEIAAPPASAVTSFSGVVALNAGDTVDAGAWGVSGLGGGNQVGTEFTVTAGGPIPPATMNLVMKLDAGVGVTDPNGLAIGDGDAVGIWGEANGGILDARAKSVWGAPILKTDGDFPVIRFDGNDGMVIYDLADPNDQTKFLDPEDPNDRGPLSLQTYTIYVVGKLNMTGNTAQIFFGNFNAEQGYSLGISDVIPDYIKFWTNAGLEMRSGGPIDDTSRYYLIAGTITNAFGKKAIVNDCVEADGFGGSSYTDATVVSVGALSNGSQFLKGDIAEIRVYDGFIQATHDSVVNELVNKYNLNRECLGGANPDQVALTALTWFGTNSNGQAARDIVNNTSWPDAAWDIALASGSLAELPADPNLIVPLNTYDNMHIYKIMEKGQEYTFSFACATGPDFEGPGNYYGMNFYFDSAEVFGKPVGISVFANATDPGESQEQFYLNDAGTTKGWPITNVPGSGTLIYKDYVKKLSVTLTDWVTYHPTVFNLDFVTRQNLVSGTDTHMLSGPDGMADILGQFTLRVDSYAPTCEDTLAMGRTYLEKDYNHDCYVNLEDFAIFAQDWLRCNYPYESGCE